MRGGFDANALCARHIIGGVARQRLHIDNLVGRDAEIVDDFLFANHPLFARAFGAGDAGSRIVHSHARTDELHQILVGGNDQHLRAFSARLRRIGGDQIVRFINILLDRRQTKSAHGGAHQRKLRDQIFRRLGAMRFVFRIDLLAERVLAFVENDREMGWRHPGRAFTHEL